MKTKTKKPPLARPKVKSRSANGLNFIRLCAADKRLSHSELIEVCQQVSRLYAEPGPPDPVTVRAADSMCSVLIQIRDPWEEAKDA
jgi:hypothetical protein